MEINVNGITLFYEVMGKGKPLLMVHGNGESHEIFYEAAQILKKYFTVYLIDSRGHGKSSLVQEYHYQDMAEDIKAFIEKLELKDVTYYGFSDGGIIGTLLAIQTDLCSQYIVSGVNVHPNGIKPSVKFLMKRYSKLKKDPLVTLMLEEPNICEEDLGKIHTPFVLLAGSQDLIPITHSMYIHACIPNSCLEIIPKRDHGNYIVHKEEIAYFILKYSLFVKNE